MAQRKAYQQMLGLDRSSSDTALIREKTTRSALTEQDPLCMAYNYVVQLGWTHTELCDRCGISMPTLRRIRDGKEVKNGTREYCIKAFVAIAREAYDSDLRNHGGEHSNDFKNFFSRVLFALCGIPD